MVLTLDPALEAPSGVFGVPVEFALPVTLVAMLLTAIVVLFYLAVRGSEPGTGSTPSGPSSSWWVPSATSFVDVWRR